MALVLAGMGYAAQKALVIGNSCYLAQPLANTINDANDVAVALRNLNFEVELYTDQDLRNMTQTISRFTSALQPGDTVVFYYSGHGAQVDGMNYLLPVDKEIGSEGDLQWDAYPADRIMTELQKADISIIILDACRDNPFKGVRSSNRGLAMMQGKAGSQYIIFSTEQGRTASDGSGERNSPFTSAFVKHITISDKKIEDLMKDVALEVREKTNQKQIPWTSGNLIQDFCFKPPTMDLKPDLPLRPKATTKWTYGSVVVETDVTGDLYIDDEAIQRIEQGQEVTIEYLIPGNRKFKLKTAKQTLEKSIDVVKDQSKAIFFSIKDNSTYQADLTSVTPIRELSPSIKGQLDSLKAIKTIRDTVEANKKKMLDQYREDPRLRQRTGTLLVKLFIGEDGAVAAVEITVIAGDFILEELGAMRQEIESWKFEVNTKTIYQFQMRFSN